jgi:hypothetical protein
MPNYSKVQFVAWEIHTGPIAYTQTGDDLKYSPFDYAGLHNNVDRRLDVLSQCMDIDARVMFTEKAILKALEKADSSNDTLKIFMAPEFLYRGAGGAYLHDLINGWADAPFVLPPPYDKAWPGLFGELKKIVADDKYSNWLFVFGTCVSASFDTKKSGAFYEIDLSQNPECYNTSLIQLGGAGNGEICYASRKHLKSRIDFINYRLAANVFKNNILPLDNKTLIPVDVVGESEGGAVFALTNVNHSDGKPIKFGIEICLDHAVSGYIKDGDGLIELDQGRLKFNDEYVDIQLVPSGGMDLQPGSVCLLPVTGNKPNSYAFNCDGLTALNPTDDRIYGAHVQVWNQSDNDQINNGNKIYEVSNNFSNVDPAVQIRVDDQINLNGAVILDTQLWNSSIYPFSNNPLYKINGCYEAPKGSGYVQIFDSKDLLPTSSL